MDAQVTQMHLAAGKEYGREATCGTKVDYRSEETATKSAEAMSEKFGRALEAYPCYWCSGWHIGRAMTEAEHQRFS